MGGTQTQMKEEVEESKQIRSQAMSQLKQDLAEDMGLWELVKERGWGALAAKDCGRIGGKMSSQLSPNLLRKIAAQSEPKQPEKPSIRPRTKKGGETNISTAPENMQTSPQNDMNNDESGRIHL